MRQFIQDGHTLVLRALRSLVGAELGMAAGGAPWAVIEGIESRDWASATFTGQLHTLELRFEGAAAAVAHAVARLTEGLPEADATMAGHLLAQAGVTACDPLPAPEGRAATRVTVEALTLVE